jgi:hypothetical protein
MQEGNKSYNVKSAYMPALVNLLYDSHTDGSNSGSADWHSVKAISDDLNVNELNGRY